MRLGLYGGVLSGGGAERVLSTLANCLSERGHDITVFCDCRTKDEYHLNPDVDLIYLGSGSESFVERNITRTRRLRRILRAKDIQVLLSFLAAPSFRSASAVRGTQVKHVLSVRNVPSKEYPGISRFLAKILFARSEAIVFQTVDAMKSFNDISTRHRVVIANPVSNSCFIESRPEASNRVVSLGRLNSQKNQEMLIDAFAMAVGEDNDAILEIYGSGELEDELNESIKQHGLAGRAFLMGRTDNPREVFKKAAIFALSSDYEGMPNALMEAMAAGLPVISTDCPIGGPRELVRDGQNGYLVPVGDAREMSRSLRALLDNGEMRKRMGQSARMALEEYRVEAVVDKWESLFADACRSGNDKN